MAIGTELKRHERLAAALDAVFRGLDGPVLFYVTKTWRLTDREELLNWNLIAEALLGLVAPILLSYLAGVLVGWLWQRLRKTKAS
jgi:hypothetical protein